MEIRHMADMLLSNSSSATIFSDTTIASNGVPNSYFTFPLYSGLMFAHVLLMIVAWVLILPAGVMLSIVRSRLVSLTQLAFLLVNALGLLCGAIYNSKTPDFYENNAHHKIGWLVTWLVSIQAAWGLVRNHRHWRASSKKSFGHTIAQYQRVQDLGDAMQYRYSRDSGQGTESNSPRILSSSSLPSLQACDDAENPSYVSSGRRNDPEEQDEEKTGLLKTNVIGRFFSTKISWISDSRGAPYMNMGYDATDRSILFLGFVALLTGGVTYGGFFKGYYLLSGLAHFVKGGIFFWYGLLTLGRVMGSFADLGWSWNVKPPANVVGPRKAALPTAEFFESFLIFLYGSTNVFLERLGSSTGDAWSAGDLEHTSISVMFFGGGLCGMLVESRKIRDLLNSTLISSISTRDIGSSIDQWHTPRTYGFSMNPLPAIIILLLGMLMSGHHQSLMVSTMLHKMWGNLFLAAALARGVTYILIYLSPPTSLLPSRPPSEIVVAFCLISGGMLFMSSNQDMVESLDAHQLNAMFIFTIMMGITATLMAWEIMVLAIKAWAARREVKQRFASRQLA